MALQKTNLVIVSAPLPADFEGDIDEFHQAIVERLSIQSPSGSTFFVIGDVEPSSDSGPWFKGGTKLYVFDENIGGYAPLDITDSLQNQFVVQDGDPGAPGVNDPVLWIRTSGNRVINVYGWTGSEWRANGNVPPSGPTASRPTAPIDFENYYDTDISALIHYERGAWRTVSGIPGDVKFVTHGTLASALTANPGWEYLGESDQSIRGRVLGIAAKDIGATPAAAYAVDTGITQSAVGDKVGEEKHVLTSTEIEQHTHSIGHSVNLHSGSSVQLHRVNDADAFAVPAPVPPNYHQVAGGSTDGTHSGSAGDGAAGTGLVTAKQYSLTTAPDYTSAAASHENRQPTYFLWALVKR